MRERSVPTAITPEKQKNGHEVIKNLKSKGNKSLKTSQGKVQNAIIIEGDIIVIWYDVQDMFNVLSIKNSCLT